jgi:hypothetical protein
MLLSNINYIVKNISHFNLYKVKYKSINNKLIFNLNLLVVKYKGNAIYKGLRFLSLIIIELLSLLINKVIY